MTPAALAWYESESDYKTVMAMCPPDESALAVDYTRYVGNLEKLEQTLPAKGFHPVRVKIKPEAIRAWANSQKRRIDREAIFYFARSHLGGQISNGRSN